MKWGFESFFSCIFNFMIGTDCPVVSVATEPVCDPSHLNGEQKNEGITFFPKREG